MAQMNAEVRGLAQLNKELDKRFSGRALNRIVDRALNSGADVIVRELERNFTTFQDTRASKDEITKSKPMTLNGNRTVVIHWSGPKQRYTIIHLNEFGTIKNPNPRGKGAIESALRAGQAEYRRVISSEIGRAIR